MPCGCSGGTWTPPDTGTEKAKDGKAKPQPAPASTVTGPAAPNYYHGQDR